MAPSDVCSELSVGRASVGDLSLSVRQRGQGRATVLLHGGGPGCHSASDFAGVVDALGVGRQLNLVDLAQYGESDAPRIDGPVLDFHISYLTRLLDLISAEPVDLVCQSLGGSVALLLAARRPDRVRRIVVTGSQPLLAPGPDSDPQLGGAARAEYFGGEGPTVEKMRTLIGSLEWFDASGVPDSLVARRFDASFADRARLPTDPAARGVPQDLSADLDRVAAEVLLVWGEHDRFSTPAYARRLASLLPAADVEVIAAAAHHPQAEHPDVYAGVVTAFLDRPT
jgi:pimeloyl-ACP methyl ester carboxylesterase